MRVFFSTLGCKLNQAEMERLARRFVAAGHALVGSLEEADLHVVNSCTVTHLAARDSRKTARRARRLPDVRTVLTGCYATGAPQEAAGLDGVDLLVANEDKDRLLELVQEAFPEPRPPQGRIPVSYVPLSFGRSRAAVKIEDGCNMRCSFCIIPHTRGRQRSRPLQEIVDEVVLLGEAGVEEVVLTGVQISAYRHGDGRLPELVETLLARTPIPRLRMTSIAPWQLDDRLLSLWPEERLCRHFHLSLQSGCDATLRRMRRPYTARRFGELVERVRGRIPGVAITTDVITGFPGESEAEFDESLAFVESQGFARAHVFTYSPREGTVAATAVDQVALTERRRRTARLREVAARSERDFRSERLGERATVVWEDQRGGWWRGTTDNYVRVYSEAAGQPPWGTVVLVALWGDGVRAQQVEGYEGT